MPDPRHVSTTTPPPWWRHRLCWLWPLTVAVGVVLWHWHAEPLAKKLWLMVNALLAVTMVLWAVGALKVTFRTRGSILRWAFWPALMGAFLKFSDVNSILHSAGIPSMPTSASMLICLVVVFPFTFIYSVFVGIMGVGGGVMACESDLDRDSAARSGIRWAWLIVLAIDIYKLLSPHDLQSPLLQISEPWLFLCTYPFLARGKRRALIGRLDLWLARRVHVSVLGRQFDFRAEVFAIAGFLLAWVLVGLKIFAPLQSSALQSSIQFSDAAGLSSRLDPGQLVLLEWDSPTLRSATTQESEAAIQAKLIQRLASLGAKRIVLPTPGEKLQNPEEAFEPVGNQEGPLPIFTETEDRRTEHDRSALEMAMREAGNVVLLAPPDAETKEEALKSEAFKRLSAVAREIASPRLRSLQKSALQTIPLLWSSDELPPAPLVLFAARHGRDRPQPPVISPDGVAEFEGKKFPLIDQDGEVLLNLNGSRGGRDFAHVGYTEVLRGDWQFAPSSESPNGGAWVPPEVYFRDKIVFLPSLRSASIAGPLGPLEATELLAHATRTLAGDKFMHPVPASTSFFWSLACALLIGRMAMKRDPLNAGWRLMAVIVFILAVSGILASLYLWLDPVWPVTSALASFLLVTQLSFSLERAAKERNRTMLHRFVDPEIVRELLDSQNSRLGLGGHRESVVILFADVRGFSRFAQNHPPEEVMRVVNAYLGVMTDALHARGGLLDKYTGDGLMAMFRLERSASVAGAVETALAMRDATLALSRELKAEGEKSLRVGISMHAGEAVVGLIGNSERQVNFTALGHTVVVAARLQTLTGGGEVVVSKEIHDAVSDLFRMEPRPEVNVKGISEPVQPFVVLGK